MGSEGVEPPSVGLKVPCLTFGLRALRANMCLGFLMLELGTARHQGRRRRKPSVGHGRNRTSQPYGSWVTASRDSQVTITSLMMMKPLWHGKSKKPPWFPRAAFDALGICNNRPYVSSSGLAKMLLVSQGCPPHTYSAVALMRRAPLPEETQHNPLASRCQRVV